MDALRIDALHAVGLARGVQPPRGTGFPAVCPMITRAVGRLVPDMPGASDPLSMPALPLDRARWTCQRGAHHATAEMVRMSELLERHVHYRARCPVLAQARDLKEIEAIDIRL